MSKSKLIGILVVGTLIVLAFGSAACSGQTPSPTAPAQSEVVNRNIKVYESPT